MIDIMKQGLGQARPNKFWKKTTQSDKQAKAGYHHDGGTLPFNIIVYSVSFSKSKFTST